MQALEKVGGAMKARRWSKTATWIGLACVTGAGFVACANGTLSNAPDDEDAGGGGDEDAASGRDGGSGVIDGGATDAGEDTGPSCIDDDAGCSTGYPGLCNGGNHHCLADGGSVCVPFYTTQPCYTGPATTRNKGICHDGTQSCVGELGACTGEALPNGITDGGGTPVEDCFNTPPADDDCDGLIDQGCPMSLSLGATRTLAGAGGGGGTPKTLTCPTGAFVTRVDSWFDNQDQKASGVSIFCATPSLVQGASSYSVTLAANTPAPYGTEHGSADPSNQRTDDCGISGLTAITYELGIADSFVEAQGYHCGSSAVTLNSDNTITFSFANVPYGNPPGDYNAYSNPPGTFFSRACNSNEVVVGFSIHDGAYLDNITPICAPLNVKYTAGTPDP